MTDDSTSPGGLDQAENTEDTPNIFDQAEGVDWFLANLVGYADANGLRQGLTLTVGGTIVTGMLIGGRVYFDELKKQMAASGRGEAPESAANILAEEYGRYADIYPLPDGSTGAWEAKPVYIHLKDACFIDMRGNKLPSNGMLWRGKLAHVSGFTVGLSGQPD